MMIRFALWPLLLAVFAGFPLSGQTLAQPQPSLLAPSEARTSLPAVSAPVTTLAHAMTATDLEAWLDGLTPTALETAQAPGAVVVVVKDGRVLFESGYGYSDYKSGAPIDAKATLFRPGSISKLFTWTAVMQQVELGKINLDSDVNAYLDFHIPAYKGVPVTMRMLMTHRAGFSETARDLLSFGKAPPAIGEVLKRYVPPRIFLPKEGPGYSNYGAALAGYIVQRVSGEPFDDYVAHHIFAPLQMTHSTFVQPLPPSMQPYMSKGYQTANRPGRGFEIVAVGPAGALTSTGDDMSHFMIAHLQNGRYGEDQILKPATAQMMHTVVTKAFPALNGNLLGFYQQNINGHRVIAHGGDTMYFHSDLSLWPDDNVGLFVSVNAQGKDGAGAFLREKIFAGFADRYFPAPPVTVRVEEATAKAHAALIAGAYASTRGSPSTFLSVMGLIMPNVVKANPDGSITAAPIGQPQIYVETSPFIWRQVHGHDRIEAEVNHGRVERWSSDAISPIMVYERQKGFAGTGLEAPLALGALGLLALTAMLWPIVAIVRWRYRGSFAFSGQRALSYRFVRAAATVGVGAVFLWFNVLSNVSSLSGTHLNVWLHLSQLASLVGFAGGLFAALWNLLLTFRRGGGGSGSRLYATLLTGAFAMMFWIALHYHLIGFASQY